MRIPTIVIEHSEDRDPAVACEVLNPHYFPPQGYRHKAGSSRSGALERSFVEIEGNTLTRSTRLTKPFVRMRAVRIIGTSINCFPAIYRIAKQKAWFLLCSIDLSLKVTDQCPHV
ncbi:MAG: hypothetical protein ACREXR_16050, partial [Gammaproteobacteria bacterium]